MKLKKILKHMMPNDRIRIYESDGAWVNSLASSPEIIKRMDRKVKRISSGFYLGDTTLTITLAGRGLLRSVKHENSNR